MKTPVRKLLPLVSAILVGLWMVLSFIGEDTKSVADTKTVAPAVETAPAKAPLTLSQSIQAGNGVSLKQAAPDAMALIKLENTTFQPHWDDQRKSPFYTIAEPSVTSLRKVMAGDKLSLPLPDHGVVEVTVHASMRDEQRETMWSIGGEIGDGEGSLYLAEDTKMDILSGVVMLRNRREAWVYERSGTGALTVSERSASEIVCTGKDGLPPIGMGGSTAAAAPISNGGGVVALSTGASGTIPNCSSKPGATAVLYLDFEAGTITQTFWNSGRAVTYESAGMNTIQMSSCWSQVAEDFSPFDVNVTTVRASYTNAPVGKRMRIIMAKNNWDPNVAGGFAAVGSFPNAGGFWSERERVITNVSEDYNKPSHLGLTPYPSDYGPTMSAIVFPSDVVAWVFSATTFHPLEPTLIRQVRSYARGATHELGHTFGLLHDGQQPEGGVLEDYYDGHGAGLDSWRPLMGIPYGAGLGQWSKGEYTDAINYGWGTLPNSTTRALQDDLAIIGAGVSGGSGNGLLADDKGDTTGTAALISTGAGSVVNDSGRINIGTDNDFFRIPITSTTALIDLTILAAGQDPNLDLYAELQNASGATLASSVPLEDRNAKIGPITVNAAGNYYLLISGSFQGTASTGWTRYGNLGDYTITGSVINGTVSGLAGATVITASGTPPDANVGISYSYPLLATNNPTSYYLVSGTVPPGLLLSGGSLTGIPTTPGWYNFTLAATNAIGGSSKFFTMYVLGPASLDESLDGFPIVWTTTSPPTNAAASLWQGQRAISKDGNAAARSGVIGANSESILSTTLKGPGKLTFYWRTSSHSSDRLIFKLNTTESPSISGETAWAQQTVLIPQGTFPVSWIYRTDAGTTAGENAGFVDRVKYLANPDFLDGNFYAGGRVGAAFLRQIPLVDPLVPTTWAHTGGVLPPGITLNPATGELFGVPNTLGTYDPEITATNDAGSSTTSPRIYIYPDVALPTGLDAEGLVWVTDPVNPWFGDNTNTHDGTDVAHSGPIRHGLSTFIQTTVTGPGTFSFWIKASTEATGDPVYFSIDGVVQSTLSGETGWAQQSYTLGSGAHTMLWNYVRDGSGNGGSNMVWVDQVNWSTPGPAITNPLTVNWTVGGVYSIPMTSDDPNATWSVTGTVPSDIYFGNVDKLVLGLPKLPRVVTFTLNATNAAGTTTSRLFTVNIESTYAAWARTKGLAVGTPLGDPDKDGILNLAECAFGLEPNVPNHGFQPVSFDPVQRRMRAIFNRRSQNYWDLRYEVQFSNDLQTWTNVASVNVGEPFTNVSAVSITESSVPPSSEYLSQVTVIANNQPSPSSQKYYMRVKVIQK